jgi:hypothetical protein
VYTKPCKNGGILKLYGNYETTSLRIKIKVPIEIVGVVKALHSKVKM